MKEQPCYPWSHHESDLIKEFRDEANSKNNQSQESPVLRPEKKDRTSLTPRRSVDKASI